MARERRVFAYSTSYQNGGLIKDSIASLKGLHPMVFIADNCSTDSTIDDIKAARDIPGIRGCYYVSQKCTRGRGRGLAVELMAKKGKPRPHDYVISFDSDRHYKKPFIDLMKKEMRELKDNEIRDSDLCFFSNYLKYDLHWKDIFAAEDMEWRARAKSQGVNVILGHEYMTNFRKFYYNPPSGGESGRYASVSKVMRKIKALVETQRAVAFKSFPEFYAFAVKKGLLSYLVWRFAYAVAGMKGVYSYNKKLNNQRYIYGDDEFLKKHLEETRRWRFGAYKK